MQSKNLSDKEIRQQACEVVDLVRTKTDSYRTFNAVLRVAGACVSSRQVSRGFPMHRQ